MPNDNLAFGIDLSRYNTSADGKVKVNFDIIAAHQPEVVFIAMRAGVSWGYQDPWFAYYLAEAQRIERVCLAYHVLYPGEPVAAQMDNFFRILGDVDLAQVPLVLDLELDHGQSVSRITQATAQAVTILTERTGRIPLIYSRTSWVDVHLRAADLPPVHWWLAQYRWPRPYPLYTPEYPSPPTPLPVGVTDWTVHQTGSRGKSIGCASYFMDTNRWNGSKADVLAFVGQSPKTALTCPVDRQPCPRLFAEDFQS
jgi:GH25 family lysozyme M1 (1,4-beta-N-acetylmuramidase)